MKFELLRHFAARALHILNRRKETSPADEASWLQRNWARVDALFRNPRIASYVFEPVAELWRSSEPGSDARIRQIISQVAVANAVIAGLPGKLGVGVAVAIALELYMAMQIARRVGIKLEGPLDAAKYFGLAAGIAYTVFIAFRHILGFFFSFFAMVGFLPATALAELFATSLIGVVFWVGFQEARETGAFVVPKRLMRAVYQLTSELVKYQWSIVRKGFSPATYAETGRRLRDWLTGNDVFSPVRLRGDIFFMAAFAHLLAGRHDQLQGPLGEIFLQAIRDTNSELAAANAAEIANHMRDRLGSMPGTIDVEAYQGMENLVRGRMFELLVERSESWDGEGWEGHKQEARLHEDFNHPGSDIVFTKSDTGEMIEVQIKATSSVDYIEQTLLRYPDTPIIVTSELGEEFDGIDMVQASVIGNDHLRQVNQENFDELLNEIGPISAADAAGAAGGAGAAAMMATLWPFIAAHIRGRITREQLTLAVQRLAPEGGKALARRVALAAAIGPLYAWWVLARGVMAFVPAETTEGVTRSMATRRVLLFAIAPRQTLTTR